MRITSKGQLTIPIDVREQLGLHPGDEVEVVVDEGTRSARIVKSNAGPSRGRRIAESLLGTGDVEMTTEEIMELTRGE
ncbi:AbrB/MazE/SpoVT family DNA-binding domain-containing protein [Umezawaea sp. Da 62-37]|uniref:AbrB/MazE/SpoVT family DNA-binding domain-containing protein n=1 Tax=Umezawaea sp. Da 62-37 TaxID=3075927 RepID=UPI0028F70A6E|nr:AbrB/MazE/SpoVT family DNA-binding domain-containing protein [Umezawaea sp. Da 62-37]WNV83279.1 AbrB/MazE/SpoVT family DNA-binding domain-containing protein [Umezawaea sp. Da 62-37]